MHRVAIQQGLHYIIANMATAAAVTTAVAAQPSTSCQGDATNRPISLRRLAMIIIATMIGTTMTPLTTALHNSALMGSSGVNPSPTPIRMATAITT